MTKISLTSNDEKISASLILGLVAALGIGCTDKQDAPPTLGVSTTALDLGDVPLGTEGSGSFDIRNDGGGELEILSVTLVDGDPDLWTVDRSSFEPLGAGASAAVTILFEPEALGLEDGRVLVRSSDEETGGLYVSLAATGTVSTADADGDGYSAATGDCDDGDASAYPGGDEVCDGVDNDCDGETPSDERDADYDGFRVCEDDCDDADPAVYPDADEICDDKDSDCDGRSADREDQDGDGYAVCDDDCDDDEDGIYPGAAETCDELDNDCSGEADDVDADEDGHTLCSVAGDCDDDDPDAYPVVVDAAAADGGDGTDQAPYNQLDDALLGLDEVCRTIVLVAGDYSAAMSWDDGALTIEGESTDSVTIGPVEAGTRLFEVSDGASLTLRNLTLSGASASGDGGAVLADGSDVTLDGVTASGNSCSGDGGVVAVSSGALVVVNSQFASNSATDDGGAIAVLSGSFIDEGSSYEGNSAVRGGAVIAEGSDVTVSDATWSGNTATDSGGALAFTRLTGLRITRGVAWLNTAGSDGGALSLADVDVHDGFIGNLFVQDNAAGTTGGGIAILGEEASFTLGNNTLTGNAAAGEGGGLYIGASDASGLVAWSNLVIASYGQSGLYLLPGAGADVAWTTSFLTSSGVEFGGDAAAGAAENAEENPDFTDFSNNGDPTDDDLSLDGGSPAIDAGPTDAAWRDRDGSTNDRGATGGPEAE